MESIGSHHGARRRLGAALCFLAILGGGAPIARAEEKAKDTPPSPPASADEDEYVTFSDAHPLGVVKDGQALLYVLRPTSVGFAIKSFFFVDDAIIGINRGSSYFFTDVTPGKHVLWSKSENVDAIEATFEAGKTYYLQQRVQLGGFRARTKLEMLGEAEGKETLGKCKKHGTLGPAGIAKGKEYAATLKANVQEDLDRHAREAREAAEADKGKDQKDPKDPKER